jgi:hypothetical protein
MTTYSVSLFGSNPDRENDDLWIYEEFETKEQALAAYENPATWLESTEYVKHNPLSEGEWVEVDGPDTSMARPLRKGEWTLSRKEQRLADAMERSERVWEHRMLYGTDD